MNYIGMVLTKDSNPARSVGKAGGHRHGESKKLTPAQQKGGGRCLAKVADTADRRLPSADPEPRQVRRNR
ncbi:hypothetical protein MBOE_17980 [Mycolicibacterium boenickei]|uniref:Uncharacterized protein n=1 Tax=Mycolicibacterium boenickei TaxID=146017 RepID=A0ABM7ITJ9_9MYCO|nr:hypothetical protein MBOE_17980 [Mycolicibacterium boenickei]